MKRYKSEEGRRLIHESYDRLLNGWNVPYKEVDVSTHYGITHIITAGDPEHPPLLLFHGTGDHSALMWIYNARELSASYYVIAVDHIGGSGKSEPNANYDRTFNQVKWMDEIFEVMKLKSVYIAGVSYGAYLAYHYAIARPEKVRKIVCMAGRVPGSQLEVMSKMMRAFLPEAMFPSEQNVRKLLRKLCGASADAFEKNPDLLQHWTYLLKYFNNRTMMKHSITIYPQDAIQTIRDKSLFLIGDQDMLSYYPKSLARLREYGINHRIVKNAGHAINHEMPELIHEEIVGFCR